MTKVATIIKSSNDTSVPSVNLINKDLLILANKQAYVNDSIMDAAMVKLHHLMKDKKKVLMADKKWSC